MKNNKIKIYLTPERNIVLIEAGEIVPDFFSLIGVIDPNFPECTTDFVLRALRERLAHADVSAMRRGSHWLLPPLAYQHGTDDTVALDVRPTKRLESANRPHLIADE